MPFSHYKRIIATICHFDKDINIQSLKRCYSFTFKANTECKTVKSATAKNNAYMQIKKQDVLKKYGSQLCNRSITNYIAIKLFLLRDVGIDSILLATFAKDIPEVYHCDVSDVEAWVKLLFQFSFERSQIIELIQNYPWMLLVPAHRMANTFHDLMQQIEIARLELPLLCCNAPNVLIDDIELTIEKHLYFHFIMTHRDFADVVNSGVFNFSIKHLKLRHQFLYRRGQYFRSSRHESLKISNPSLTEIFCSSDEKFCEVANCDLKEYRLFEKLFVVEMQLEEEITAATAKTQAAVESKSTAVNDIDDEEKYLSEKSSLADELVKHL